MKKFLLLPILLILLLSACGGSGGSGGSAGDPAETVQAYLAAKGEGNAALINQLLCSEMESVAERESKTFESVSDVHLEGMSCAQVGDTPVVKCDGRYVATYGTEDTEFPLTSYRVVQEDGEWKWCGEAAN